MSNADIETLTETAFINWLNNHAVHGITLNIPVRYFAQDHSDTLTLPAIIVRAIREAEDPPYTGIWRMRVEVELLAQADDTNESALTTAWSNVVAILGFDDLPSQLSALDNFHCFGVVRSIAGNKQTVERHWLYAYPLTAFCMPQNNS